MTAAPIACAKRFGGPGTNVGAMPAVMAVIAVLVYDRWGVGILRRSWINLDGVWAAAFVVAGLVTLFS